MQRADAAGEEPRVKAGEQTKRPQRTRGAPSKGEGMSNRRGWSAAGRGPPSSSISPRKPREGGGGGRGYAGSEPRDCVEARKAAATLVLVLTVDALS